MNVRPGARRHFVKLVGKNECFQTYNLIKQENSLDRAGILYLVWVYLNLFIHKQ
jgi:hypothetical protein